MVKIRALSALKFATEKSSITWSYGKGCKPEDILMDMLALCLREKGAEYVQALVNSAIEENGCN